jgi:hypothetical protein
MEQPSAAVQVVISVIPIVGIVMGSVVIFLYLIFNHKQKILMIEKGISRKSGIDLILLSFFSGMALTGVGFGLTLFFILKDGISYGMLSGLIPLSLGISFIIFFAISSRIKK